MHPPPTQPRAAAAAAARYTVHLGPRAEAWPPVVAASPTRHFAQRIAVELLAAAPAEPPHKAEVRERGVRLLDCYGRRGGSRVFHVYAARQRSEGGPHPSGDDAPQGDEVPASRVHQ